MGQFPLSFIFFWRNTGTYEKTSSTRYSERSFFVFLRSKKNKRNREKNASTENHRFGIFCKFRKNITELSQKSVQKFPQYPPAQ